MGAPLARSWLAAWLIGVGLGFVSPAPAQDKAPPAATELVSNGQLTAAGLALRDRGLSQYQAHLDQQAFDTWLPLAEAGHAESQNNLAALLLKDQGIPVDRKAALRWYERAATNGYASAYCDWAEELTKEPDSPALRQRVHLLFLTGAELGQALCMHNAASSLLNGYAEAARIGDGMKWLRQAAGTGLAPSQYMLGTALRSERYVTPDPVEARHWLEAAAAQGHPEAQFELATMWMEGEGGPRDASMGATLFRKAAEQNHHRSANNLALLLLHGEGVAQDVAQAQELFRKAAYLGNIEALINLGDMAVLGTGQAADVQLAASFYDEAYKSGSPWAACRLSSLLQQHRTQLHRAEPWQLLAAKARAALPDADCSTPLTQYLRQ